MGAHQPRKARLESVAPPNTLQHLFRASFELNTKRRYRRCAESPGGLIETYAQTGYAPELLW